MQKTPRVRACGHVPRPLRGRMLPLPPPRCPGLTPTSPTTHTDPFAALSQVAAPSQHRRRAPREGGREGRRAARPCPNGHRTLAQAVGVGRGASGTFGGVHATRVALSVAGTAAGRAPHGRGLCSRMRRDLAVARSTLFGASGGPETALEGLGAVWRWHTVTPWPAALSGMHLWRRSWSPARVESTCAACEKNIGRIGALCVSMYGNG